MGMPQRWGRKCRGKRPKAGRAGRTEGPGSSRGEVRLPAWRREGALVEPGELYTYSCYEEVRKEETASRVAVRVGACKIPDEPVR